MSRSTLSDAKDPASGIARVLNLSPSDDRFRFYLNEATRRLVETGELFYGLFARYQFCVTDSCLTWPRQIATIESAAVCNNPITIRNQWFEFLESSSGLQTADGLCNSNPCAGWPYAGNCGGQQL